MKQRVVVGLSGGVDSSVAAALLIERGYEVIGAYILGWTGTEEFPCSWQEEESDARKVAEHLSIPFYTVNLSKDYESSVIDDFFAKYREGLTPNPDVLCNREIKFKALWDAVRQFEPDFIATGHYARIEDRKIFKGKDQDKDQSYFLWGVESKMVEKILFPIGDLRKAEVRQLAKKYRLPTANKKDSQGICFIGPLKVRKFLASKLMPNEGVAVLKDGRFVGSHKGFQLYTIGQRLGSGSVDWTGDVPPLFVVAKDAKNNLLVVGTDQDTYSKSLLADSTNWLTAPTSKTFAAYVKIRYRQEDIQATINQLGKQLTVTFDKPVRAITPGQSLVIYSKEGQLLGGAFIVSVPEQERIIKEIHAKKRRHKNEQPTAASAL